MADTLAVSGEITVVGFAIQRALQIFDPIVDLVLDGMKAWFLKHQITSDDLKRTATALIAVALGFYVAIALDLRFLHDLGVNCDATADLVVSAFVMSAGAEGANSVTKLLESVKVARQNAAAAVAVVVPLAALVVKPGDKGKLVAAVANSGDQSVVWMGAEPALVVDPTGAFTAPAAGTYHAIARATVDPTKTATVTITVVA